MQDIRISSFAPVSPRRRNQTKIPPIHHLLAKKTLHQLAAPVTALPRYLRYTGIVPYFLVACGEGECIQNDIGAAALYLNLEQKLTEVWNNELILERYRKVLAEFTAFTDNSSYSQSLGADFLVARFTERGGLVSTGEHSRKEEAYFRCMQIFAEHHDFSIIHRRNDFFDETIWPGPFCQCTEGFSEAVMKKGLLCGYATRSRVIVHDLLLFLDARGVHTSDEISVQNNDEFIKSSYGLSPRGIEMKLCTLREYYRHLYLQGHIRVPLAEHLSKTFIQGRIAFPTVWGQNEVKEVEGSAERTDPAGKRSCTMVLLATRLGLRIDDIRNPKLHDIDWTRKQISVIRHKTQKALLLPLLEEAGWVIIGYLKNGRSATESPHVLVRHRPPYDTSSVTSSLSYIFSSVMVNVRLPSEKNTDVDWCTF